METQITSNDSDGRLLLHDRTTQSPFLIYPSTLTLNQKDDTLIECRLTFQVSPELYQHIDCSSLFNLKPELRNFVCAGDFLSETNIEIEATLQPDLVSHLKDYTTGEAVAAYLQTLSQNQPDHPLLATESWYALHVKQAQESGETGYRTLWSYVNPAVIVQENLSSEQITEGMVGFFKDWMNNNPTEMTQDSLEATLDKITQSFDEWAETSFTESDRVIDEAINEATDALDELIDHLSKAIEEIPQSIYQEIITFFSEDDWSFTKLQGEPILSMAFQGQNGEWTCYAKAREEQHQFVFYSLCPINAPEDKRLAVAEFLTHANYGMIIGNFEFDFNDGEIRYKTSIDVAGDSLSFALIKNLVYTNVTIMDGYLPGILSVINGHGSPKDTITQIEITV